MSTVLEIIERLEAVPVYSARELCGVPFQRVGQPDGSGTLDVRIILVGLETRDEIIKKLRSLTPQHRSDEP